MSDAVTPERVVPGADNRSNDEYLAFLKQAEQPVTWRHSPSRGIWEFEPSAETPPDGSDWFFVVGHPRTGSSVAAALLSRHPEIYCGHEHQVMPLLMAVLGAEVFVAPRLWYAVRYHKRIAMTPANLRRLMDAWRLCVSDRPLFGDKGEMFYEHFGDAAAAVFPRCRFVLTTRHPLDTLSSYSRQGWAAWMHRQSEPDGFYGALRKRAHLMLSANRHWSGRAEVLAFDDLADRERFEAACGRIFRHLGADPSVFDYDAAWPSCRHAAAMDRWRGDEQITGFLRWLRQEDPALHHVLETGAHAWPDGAPQTE